MIDVPGQPLAERILRSALERDRPPQQLLFHGPAGSGKRRAAKVLGWALADPGTPHDPDDVGLDITVLDPPGHLIRRPDLEPALADLAARPVVHARRVLIINEAARMDADEAASRMLKSLEEPGAHAHIILVSDRVDDLLPTIRSRCLPVPFRSGGPGGTDDGLPAFTREMRAIGVELGLAVMRGEAETRRLVVSAQEGMERFARDHPSDELAALIAEAERLDGKRGGRTAAKRAEDQARREVRRAITDGWGVAFEGWAGLVADAVALAVGHSAPIRHPEHAEALRAAADADPGGRGLTRVIDELVLARSRLSLNPTTDLAAEAVIARVRRAGTPQEPPLLPSGRIE